MGKYQEEDFTLEFKEVMNYMTITLYNEFPTDALTIEYLILSILDNRNCHANMILDNCLMSENIEELRKIYVSVIGDHIKPQLKGDAVILNDDLIRAIDLAKEESIKLNSNLIGTEHILLAILNKANGFSETEVFDKFRLEYDFIYNKCNVNGENKKEIKPKKLQPKKMTKKVNNIPLKSQVNTKIVSTNSTSEFISQYTTSLNRMAEEGKIDEIVGRKQEINEIIRVLSRRKKNNAVLVGHGGAGKTAIVYGIANMIVKGDVPECLEGKEMVMLNPIALVSGTHFRGMFEERIKARRLKAPDLQKNAFTHAQPDIRFGNRRLVSLKIYPPVVRLDLVQTEPLQLIGDGALQSEQARCAKTQFQPYILHVAMLKVS